MTDVKVTSKALESVLDELKKLKEERTKIDDKYKEMQVKKKEELEALHLQRLSTWREARSHIPEITNREIIEHHITEIHKGMGWNIPAYVHYILSPPIFNNRGSEPGYYSKSDNPKTKWNRLVALTEACETVEDRYDPFGPLYNKKVLGVIPNLELPIAEHLFALLKEVVDFIPASQKTGDPAIVLQKPLEIHFTRRGQVHNDDGPAVIWRDGYREYWFTGVKATKHLIEGDVKLSAIRTERNQERRRFLLERYGFEKYLRDTKAELISEDKKGKLWKIKGYLESGWRTLPDEYYVDVMNSTPEPDGSVRRFLLRVPPETKTAAEGVAWTFSKDLKDYKPKKET